MTTDKRLSVSGKVETQCSTKGGFTITGRNNSGKDSNKSPKGRSK